MHWVPPGSHAAYGWNDNVTDHVQRDSTVFFSGTWRSSGTAWRGAGPHRPGLVAGLTSQEKAELTAAQRRIADLEAELSVSSRAVELLRGRRSQKEVLDGRGNGRENLPVQVTCRVFGTSESGSAQNARGPVAASDPACLLTDLITEVHRESRGIYGARRVHAELVLDGQIGSGTAPSSC